MLIEKSRLSLAAASAIFLAGLQPATAAPASEGKIDSGDVALHYRLLNAEAEATPLLILHGAFMSGGEMEPLAARFADRPVILLDQRAHGRSGDSEADLTYPQLGDDAARLVEELGYERADVLGYSMGGGAALQMAIRHPERIGKLVMLSATYRRDGWYPEVLAGIGALTADFMEATPMGDEYRRLSPTPDGFERYFERVKKLNFEEQDIPDDQMRAIEAPTMVIIGDADGVRPEHALQMFLLRGGGDVQAAAMGMSVDVPKARLLILPATTHLGLLALDEDIARHVSAFLDDAPPPLPEAYARAFKDTKH